MTSQLAAPALRALLRQARSGYRAGAPAILDRVLAAAGAAEEEIAALLPKVAGVEVMQDPAMYEVDFSQWKPHEAGATRAVVLRDGAGCMVLVCEDPWNQQIVQQVVERIGQQPRLAVARGSLISSWLASETAAIAPTVANATTRPAHGGAAVEGATSESPVIAFVDEAIRAAHALGASDVHFETDRQGMQVKLRQDGVLVPHSRIGSLERAQEVVSRIKVLAQLDITERRLPQDGRFRIEVNSQQSLDLRVSIMPSIHGEDAVLRLLDQARLRQAREQISLSSLGFAPEVATKIRELAERPNGMVLVTGPTGSGKTTTIYAVLNEINTGIEKIVTIEDPVEYELPGVLQIPVNDRKGLTFAKGLRSILRHDPDRILVGEIRDPETAEIAVQSALTGHLVFSTVHANGMADIMGRFRHFGLDMFGFMSSLNGVIVQRLVRRLCSQCAAERDGVEVELAWMRRHGQTTGNVSQRVPRAVGCPSCNGTGYAGRFVLAEVHELMDDFRDAVLAGAPVSRLKTLLRAGGGATLEEQAARCVSNKMTTLDEVKRVVGFVA